MSSPFDDPAAEFARNIGLGSFVCIPLMIDDRVTGTFGYGRRWSSRFDTEELVFLRSVTAYVALAEEHLKSRHALEVSEQSLRLAQDLAGVGSFDWNLLTGEGSASGGCFELLGQGRDVTPSYSNVLKLVLPEDANRFRADVDAALTSGETFRSEFRIIRPDNGRICWLHADGGIVRDESGRATRMVGIVRDVTERRQAQEREHLLMREVDHRAKNLLTVVQSVLQLTRAPDIEEFVEAVSGRIQALGRAHSLLAASRWEGAELTTLVNEEIAPFAQHVGRIRVEGPPVKLKPAAAQSVALVLHELLTNAAKYGALSTSGGTVDLRWSLHPEVDDRLTLLWREQGGPPVRPPTDKGFGTTVIEASVDRQLGGSVHYDWRETGLCCEINLPAKQLVHAAPADFDATTYSIPATPIHNGKGTRVLVVEDEPLIALQIAQVLEKASFAVVGPAANISEAMELMQAGEFDFAILDVELGGSRSFTIADVLAEQDKPFAFMTGFTAAELPERFRGVTILPKPLCPQEIAAAVSAGSATKAPPAMSAIAP